VRSLGPRQIRILLRVACAAVLIAVLTQTRADPDLFGHVRFGQDILAARSVHLNDSYSFASDRRWINHEWLSEVAMYVAYHAAGAAGLIALKLSLLVLTFCAVVLTIRRSRPPDIAQDLLLGVAVVCTFPQTNHVRPQLFSVALFAWLLFVLLSARRHVRAQWWSIPIMAVWVNVHGGWLVGVGTLWVWTATGWFSDASRRDKLVASGIAACATVVTLVNPYGVQLLQFLHETVGLGREDITDWQPVFRLGAMYGVLWALVAVFAVVVIVSTLARRKTDLQSTAIVLMLAVTSFRVNRLLAFFALSVVMLFGAEIAALFRRDTPAERRRVATRWASATVLAVALVLVAGGVTASARYVSCIRMEDSMFPEPEALAIAANGRIHGRMLTYFDYGEYAIWYLSPNVLVSMDGRRETVYSDEAIQRQLRFYFRPGDRKEIVNALQPDYIWMPSSLGVTKDLASDGWKPMFAGPRTVILGRGGVVSAHPYQADAVAPRCFPGP
jgi:hypothetical protein